jgi:lysophospholipase L1-like esterase
MRYLALGDSMSIDDYTGVRGGGAASQLAKLIRASEFIDLTRDGQITPGVLRDLARKQASPPDVVTLTIGGNDFLGGAVASEILGNLREIAEGLAGFEAKVIMNTVYDPTDGRDDLAPEIGLSPAQRADFRLLNEGISALAQTHGYLLCNLERLFRGHGIGAPDSWIVMGIEPNLAGATAIAAAWSALLGQR